MSNTKSLLILFITAALSSRFMLLMMDDPEGPNLLVVFVIASFVWEVTAGVYVCPWFRVVPFSSDNTTTRFTNLLLAIALQVLVVAALYFVFQWV